MVIAKRIGNIALAILAVFGAVMTLVLIYITTFGRALIPTSLNSTLATSITDPLTGEKMPPLTANFYENKNGSGYQVMEFRINAYSGPSKQALYPRGFQMVWDKKGNIVPYVDPVTNEKYDVWFYDTDPTFTESFSAGNVHTVTSEDYYFLIDIDDKLCGLKLDGEYVAPTNYNFFKSVGKRFHNYFVEGDIFGTNFTGVYETKTVKYDFADLLIEMRRIIKSCSKGSGDYVVNLADLGDFLHIYDFDEKGIRGEPIGGKGVINSYFSMQVHYDVRGMMWTKQSLFGSVAGDFDYNMTGINEDVDYWKAVTNYDLTETDFEARYSVADGGYYYVLPTATLERLKDCEDVEIYITFDISKIDKNVLGFDYYALNGIKVERLTITSDTLQDFKFMAGSLKDTGLTVRKISTRNIKLINQNSGVELP